VMAAMITIDLLPPPDPLLGGTRCGPVWNGWFAGRYRGWFLPTEDHVPDRTDHTQSGDAEDGCSDNNHRLATSTRGTTPAGLTLSEQTHLVTVFQ
jgi:hypothetical protein